MAGDRKGILVGAVATVIVGMTTTWYMILVNSYQASVDLYTAGKISEQQFAARSTLFAALGLAPPILGGLALLGALLFWQRQRLRRAMRWVRRTWPYLWPPIALSIALLTPALVAYRRPGLVAISLAVAITAAGYVVHSRARRFAETAHVVHAAMARLAQRMKRAQKRPPYTYDLIEAFRRRQVAVYSTESPEGMVSRLVAYAPNGKVMGSALWQHPPWKGDAILEYVVPPIDRSIAMVKLEGSYGILEGFLEDDGETKLCGFPGKDHERNTVRFEARINGCVILSDDLVAQEWRAIKHESAVIPYAGLLTVQLRTNANGDPHFNWAAWRDLRLVECT